MESQKYREQLRRLLVLMYGKAIENDVDEIIRCIEQKVVELYRRKW